VAFAYYNKQFEAVVSGDDGSFIAVWDIETGQLMSKFGNAHGVIHFSLINIQKAKITAACFDGSGRRLISAGSDGTCKIYNFSNGHKLTELYGDDKGRKIESEITAVTCIFDPDDIDKNEKVQHIVAVGWDKKVYIWIDEKQEEVKPHKVLPYKQRGHE